MSEFDNLYIFGYSGHSYVVIATAFDLGWNLAGYFDYDKAKKNPYDIPYLGMENRDLLESYVSKGIGFPSVGNNRIRMEIIELLNKVGMRQTRIVSSSAQLCKGVPVGNSTFIAHGALIQPQVKIGAGCILNTGCIVEHECVISDYVHVAPGAVLAGGVNIGEQSFIGANATIKEGLTIGENVVIGAGSTVLKSIQGHQTWVGSPAKRIA